MEVRGGQDRKKKEVRKEVRKEKIMDGMKKRKEGK